MKRFILTGTPGAGKTAILRQLEIEGFDVVEEAATDVIALEQAKGIAEPWLRDGFLDRVVDLQKRRLDRASSRDTALQFHDRSAFCTAALAAFLGRRCPDTLSRELDRIERGAIYQKRVFFVLSPGFVTPTEARRISLEEARRFETLHEEMYRARGFELVPIEPGAVLDRVAAIRRTL
jgi:predicted ATPase